MAWNAGEKNLTIAIDFDDCYTADPELWDAFISHARERGHRVICCTCRRETMDNVHDCDVPGVLTHFTGGSPKRWYLEQRGIFVDIFIDDHPECVKEGR